MNLRRDRKRARKRNPPPANPYAICRNCGEKGAHYVPPSFGTPGVYICKAKVEVKPS